MDDDPELALEHLSSNGNRFLVNKLYNLVKTLNSEQKTIVSLNSEQNFIGRNLFYKDPLLLQVRGFIKLNPQLQSSRKRTAMMGKSLEIFFPVIRLEHMKSKNSLKSKLLILEGIGVIGHLSSVSEK